MLWRKRVDPGSAEHTLKKEIARVLAKRETVPGITRQDIGLSN
jgi:riboflavin synthase